MSNIYKGYVYLRRLLFFLCVRNNFTILRLIQINISILMSFYIMWEKYYAISTYGCILYFRMNKLFEKDQKLFTQSLFLLDCNLLVFKRL